MDEKTLQYAKALVQPSEAEEDLLAALCAAASAELARRLKPGLTPADCGDAFTCAAAYTAAACFLPSRAERDEFTAGDVSVKPSGEFRQTLPVMMERAESLIAPYVTDGGFAFLGVRG